MRDACVACDAWPPELLSDPFIDGMCGLARACEEAEVSDAGLAAAATDASPGLSSVARAVLTFRSLSAPPAGLPAEAAVAESSPIDIDDFAAAIGVEAGRLHGALGVRTGAGSKHQSPKRQYSNKPWIWPVREEQRPIVVPAMTFSASRLNTFAKCPRRFFFEYLCDAVEDPGSVHTTYGKVFHEALEALHREIRVPSQVAANAIFERLESELDAAFGRARTQFASELEYAVCRVKARAVGEHYVRWLSREAAARPMEVRDIEVLGRFSSGGHSFVGYIDRIDHPLDGGPVTIYDYKTGRIASDPNKYLHSVRSGEEGQLALYWAMRRAQRDAVARMALISIRDPREPVWLLALDVVESEPTSRRETGETNERDVNGVIRILCTPADLEASIAALIARCDALTGGRVEHFGAGEDPPCSFCAYGRACRERPLEPERIFAR